MIANRNEEKERKLDLIEKGKKRAEQKDNNAERRQLNSLKEKEIQHLRYLDNLENMNILKS